MKKLFRMFAGVMIWFTCFVAACHLANKYFKNDTFLIMFIDGIIAVKIESALED